MRRLFVVVTTLLLFPLSAFAQDVPRALLGKRVRPFDGAVEFCKAIPSRCEPHPEARVVMDAVRMADLVFTNLIVNAELTFQAEPPGVDIWQDRDFTAGDCEDYALLKRRELIKLGWPPGALHLAIVLRKEEDPEFHGILLVSTDQGDFVLDIPGLETGRLRLWNPKEFYALRMIWGADGNWYELLRPPLLVTVGQAVK